MNVYGRENVPKLRQTAQSEYDRPNRMRALSSKPSPARWEQG
jgi:hypothetical protein